MPLTEIPKLLAHHTILTLNLWVLRRLQDTAEINIELRQIVFFVDGGALRRPDPDRPMRLVTLGRSG